MGAVEDIPVVLEDDEVPFVVRAEADTRSHLDAQGIRLRRGKDRVTMEMEAEGAWVTMTLIEAGPGSFLIASLGGLMTPFWDAYESRGMGLFTATDLARCPLLATALMNRKVPMNFENISLDVAVVPPEGDVTMTTTVVATEEHVLTGMSMEVVVLAMAPGRLAVELLRELHALQETASASARPAVAIGEWTQTIGSIADTSGKVLDVLNKACQLFGS